MMRTLISKAIFVILATLGLYWLANSYMPVSILNFFRIFASFGDVSFAVPWVVLPLPGILIIIYNSFARLRIWNLEHVTKESMLGVIAGIALQILFVFDALTLQQPLGDIAFTFLFGILTIIPPIWFSTLVIVYAHMYTSGPHRVFVRRKRR